MWTVWYGSDIEWLYVCNLKIICCPLLSGLPAKIPQRSPLSQPANFASSQHLATTLEQPILSVLTKSINWDITLFHRFLCLQNLVTANLVFFKYTAQHPDFSGTGPPYQKPLLNFVWFLLLVIERFVLKSQKNVLNNHGNIFSVWRKLITSSCFFRNIVFFGITYYSGYEIAPSWSPMWLKILLWRPEFHNYSPVGD